jgi:hypothetical protein
MSNSGVCLRSNSLFFVCVLASLVVTRAFAPSHRSRHNSGIVLRSSTAAFPDGIVKQVSSPGSGKAVNLGDIATVRYSCYVSGNRDALPVARADRQKMVCASRSCDSIGLSLLLTFFWNDLGCRRWYHGSWMG